MISFKQKDIENIKEYPALDNNEALMLLARIDIDEINDTYELSRSIPMRNSIERKNQKLICDCLYDWLCKNRYGLEYISNGKITYAGTYDLDVYRFHK